MKAFNFDLSKFKKSTEDKQYTTLESPDGHKVMILHAKLPPMMQEQLKRLKMANGGKVQKYDGGGGVSTSGPLQVEPISDNSSDSNQDSSQTPDQSHTTIVNVGTPAAAPAQSSMAPVAGVQNAATTAGQLQPTPQAGAPLNLQNAQNYMNANGTANSAAAAQGGLQAIGQKSAVDAAQGAAMADVEAQRQKAQVALAQAQQAALYEFTPHVDALANYVATHPIDPNHWAENQSVPGKIANFVGLLAGGFKQGFSGGNNPAMDWINGQINRDIQGQKDRMDQQRTIYGAYHQLYGDTNTTNALTKASMDDIYATQVKRIADGLATPQAQAASQFAQSNFAIDKADQLRNAAFDAALRSGGGGAQGAPKVAPDYFQSHILAPDAAQQLHRFEVDPQWKSSFPKILEQFNQAKQAEKGAARAPVFFDRLAQSADQGGAGMRAGQAVQGVGSALLGAAGTIAGAVSGHPGVGGTAGAGVGQLAPALTTSNMRDYQSNQGDLVKYIATALRGTNVGGDQIEDFVKKHSPVYGDTPERRAQLKQDIVNFILDAPETGLLGPDATGLSGRRLP